MGGHRAGQMRRRYCLCLRSNLARQSRRVRGVRPARAAAPRPEPRVHRDRDRDLGRHLGQVSDLVLGARDEEAWNLDWDVVHPGPSGPYRYST
jgi:hypothetical protein